MGVLALIGAMAALLVFLGSAQFSAGQPAPKKLASPNNQELDRAAALVDELYRDELAKAKSDPQAAHRLALTFLDEAGQTNDDTAGKYVLLREAARLAAKAGDAPTALHALEEQARAFEIAATTLFAAKVQALQAASQATATPESYQGILDAARILLEEAVTADDFTHAVALGVTAEAAGKKLKSVPLVSSIRKRNDEIKALQAEYAKVKPFVEALTKDFQDAKATVEVGKYYALVRGNWEKGLPLLAKGMGPLSEIAAFDLRGPSNWQQIQILAVNWEKQAGQLQGQAKSNALIRAYHWFQRALASAPDTHRKELEAALHVINDQLPQEQRIGEIAVELRRLSGHSGPVFGVAISGDGSKIASAGGDGTVRLWGAKTSKEFRRFEGHSGPVWAVAMTPDGKRVVSGGFDKTVRVWDPISGRELKKHTGHDDYVRSIAISADGASVLSGGDDRQLLLWDGLSPPKHLRGHDHFVFGAALSRDGKLALSASLDRTARLWDLEVGNATKVLEGHADTVLSIAFTPDGGRAISASTDKTLRLWDLKTAQTTHIFKGHAGFVHAVAVSADGRRALSAGQDGKVILWDLDQAKLLRVLDGHAGPVWSVAFSGDGRFAVSGGNDGTVRLWGSAR